jgi:hypothetical protein
LQGTRCQVWLGKATDTGDAEFLWLRYRLTNHRSGEHRAQPEGAIHDAVVKPGGADPKRAAVDDVVRAVIDLSALPVQGAKLSLLIATLRINESFSQRRHVCQEARRRVSHQNRCP